MIKKFFQLPLSFLLGLYACALLLFTIFSYSLTDPNLILSSWPPYWNFQQWMWQTFFHNAPLMTEVFVALIALLFILYGWILAVLKTRSGQWRSFLFPYLLIISPLFFSYNMLSHDVFNYIFNAKMIVVYHANPHEKVALDFYYDDWTRFMHNTHTPAPYGYGWTALSVLPYLAGMGKFVVTWLIFRGMSVIGIGLLFLALIALDKEIHHTEKKSKKNGATSLSGEALALVFLNPLFLIELISSSHNDMWMMAPAVYAMALVTDIGEKKHKLLRMILSVLMLGFSISTKFATAALLPIWFWLVVRSFAQKWMKNLPHYFFSNAYWPTLAAFFLFLPLLTERSQQFNPWYLTWTLVWLPFVNIKWIRWCVIFLSFTALLRYSPWLWNGDFTDFVIWQQKAITWIPFIFFALLSGTYLFLRHFLFLGQPRNSRYNKS